MRGRLDEARRALGPLAARQKAAEVRRKYAGIELGQESFARFDRLSEKIVRAEAEADALFELQAGGLTGTSVQVEAEPASDAVEDELTELKRRLNP